MFGILNTKQIEIELEFVCFSALFHLKSMDFISKLDIFPLKSKQLKITNSMASLFTEFLALKLLNTASRQIIKIQLFPHFNIT